MMHRPNHFFWRGCETSLATDHIPHQYQQSCRHANDDDEREPFQKAPRPLNLCEFSFFLLSEEEFRFLHIFIFSPQVYEGRIVDVADQVGRNPIPERPRRARSGTEVSADHVPAAAKLRMRDLGRKWRTRATAQGSGPIFAS